MAGERIHVRQADRAAPRRAAPGTFTWGDLFAAAAIASIAVVLWIWFAGHGALSITEPGSAVGSLGLLTGLLAADFMLIQAAMLARIPWVEQAWAHGTLVRWHSRLGYASFWLMIAHVVLFAAQSLGLGQRDGADALLRLFVTDPWLLWASVGTALLILVVVTSIRAARRRLRYESWHLIHLYAYLGMAFALPHIIADGADFRGVAAQVYWWSIYAFVLAALIVFRVALPIGRSLGHRMRVGEVRVEAPGIVSVTITGRRLDRFHSRAGQFFVWRFLDGPGSSRGHPYALSAAPEPGRLRITVEAVGEGSERAAGLRSGARVLVEGPYGTMTEERRTRQRMLLMAAGIGITPLRALLEEAHYSSGEATLLNRFHGDEPLFSVELDRLARDRGVEVHHLAGRRRAEGSWLPAGLADGRSDAETLLDLVPDAADRDVFLCGPPAWMASARSALVAAGVPAAAIRSENFAW
jgi:predicted ferric reductase